MIHIDKARQLYRVGFHLQTRNDMSGLEDRVSHGRHQLRGLPVDFSPSLFLLLIAPGMIFAARQEDKAQ